MSVSLPDVFVPACLTPGTTALIVVHNQLRGETLENKRLRRGLPRRNASPLPEIDRALTPLVGLVHWAYGTAPSART